MRPISECRFYGILDLGYVGAARATALATLLIEGGVEILQLRAKNKTADEIREIAQALHSVTSRRQVPLIINDDPDVAGAIGAEGVHVGQDDMPVQEARRIAGRPVVVGKSTHNVEQAIAAEREGADYIGFGPLFATPTKPDYRPIGLNDIERLYEQVKIPVFCIGGIKLDNLAEVIAAGARGVVIVSGLLQASDPADYARSAKQVLIGAVPIETQKLKIKN